MSGSETERIAFLDAARGVGILLVVVTHAIIPAMREASPFLLGFWNVTYAFHITIFFLVSGFCYELGLTRHPQRSFLS